MDVANNNQRSIGRLAFWRRKEPWLVISGYHAGDIHSEEAVLIQPEATVVGNVVAPRITIAGQLNGSLIAQQTIVQATGKVWGDVYTVSLELLAGGKIQGWITSLDAENYPQIQADGTIPPAQPLLIPADSSDNMLDLSVRPPSADQIFALRYLQTEAATAMAARAELEQTFEKRLTEVAGESTARVQTLHEELDASRATLNELRLQLAEAEETIRVRNNRLDRQAKELNTTRSLLTDHSRELNNLRQTTDSQQTELTALSELKKRLEQTVLLLQEQLEEAQNRAKNLEGALQNNLQHSAEQEESLIRWQELVEVTQRRVSELEGELDQAQLQLTEATQVNEILREQRQQLEDEWQQALDALDHLREEQLAAPPQEVAELQATLAETKTAVNDTLSQLLWQRTNNQALQNEVEALRLLATERENALTELQNVLLTNQSQSEADQNKLQAQLHKQQQRWQQQLRQLREKTAVEQQQLQEVLRETHDKLNKSEAAMDDYYQQVRLQGQELAESRVALVEKDVELTDLQQKVAEQAKQATLIKQQARTYIQKLQQKLTQTERQVHDLTQLLERKTKR